MNIRPTVWVVKEQIKTGSQGSSPMDYTPAYEYGDVKFITDFDMPLHPASSLHAEWHSRVRGFIKDYNPEVDFLILTGSPLAIFLVGHALSQIRSQFPIKILVWRREQGRYVLTTA